MRLYVLRHGKAGEGYPDEIRELTDRGRSDLQQVVKRRHEEILDVGHIECSPLVRAVQTAEIVKAGIGLDKTLVVNEALVPWGEPKYVLDSLEEQFTLQETSDRNAILVASHQPLVSRLVDYLTGVSLNMPTSCLASIDTEFLARGCGNLNWIETP